MACAGRVIPLNTLFVVRNNGAGRTVIWVVCDALRHTMLRYATLFRVTRRDRCFFSRGAGFRFFRPLRAGVGTLC